MANETDVSKFEYEDFDSGKVFQYLYSIQDDYTRNMAVNRCAKRAGEVNFKNFKFLWSSFRKSQEQKAISAVRPDDNATNFQDQGIDLITAEWHADETGIWKYGTNNNIILACSHPIAPVKRKKSIDTKALKYTIAWHRGTNRTKDWDMVDIDAADMLSPTKIVERLAPLGVSVSGGDRAKALVDWLRDVADINYETIPETQSVSRMGWNELGFSPYVDGVDFDGAAAFGGMYDAIKPVGDYDAWLAEARDARTYSITAHIVLAASFAAPLIEILGTMSFFVHLWSVNSATGKTVGQMLGASVWANPAPGGAFFHTFRSTSVGVEMMAGFLHNLPMFIDELQLAKDHHGKVNFNVYELASGSGKLRSNRSLGLNYTPQWSTVFITSGETPITKETDGEGALNRVLEVECTSGNKVINDGLRTANVLRQNYGHAGKDYIQHLQEEGQQECAKELYKQFFAECVSNNTTDKQAMAAATILTADTLATEWIFKDGKALTITEVSEFLKSKERVSLMQRSYDILCDWVSSNRNKLRGIREEDRNECYGLMKGNTAYIIRSVFTRVCEENEIDQKGILSHLRSNGLLDVGKNGFAKAVRLGPDTVSKCVGLKLPKEKPAEEDSEFAESDENDEIPF